MYGLESKKRRDYEEFVFELEKDLKVAKTHQEIKAKIDSRTQKIKEALRTGGNKEEFDLFGVLLHGYTSILKVMSRIKPK